MNKSMRLMVLALCATGLVVMQGRASEANKGLETPLLPVVGETKSDSVAVDIGALAKAAGTPEELSSASSSSKSSPAKSDDGLLELGKDAKAAGCMQKVKQWFRTLTDKQKELLGYAGVTLLAGANEAYSDFLNPSYGFAFALFVGQLAAIVAKERPYMHKFTGGMGIGVGVSLIELILYRTHNRIPDLLLVASAAAFVLHSTILDLMKKTEVKDPSIQQNGDEDCQSDG